MYYFLNYIETNERRRNNRENTNSALNMCNWNFHVRNTSQKRQQLNKRNYTHERKENENNDNWFLMKIFKILNRRALFQII